jgi:hypothetical protein
MSIRAWSVLVLLAACKGSSPDPRPQPLDAAALDGSVADGDVDLPPEASVTHDAPAAADSRDVRVALCKLDPPTSCPDPPVRYADIAPVVQRRCLVCHDGRGPHWPLTSYQHVADWQDTIRATMLDCSMPPAEAALPMPLEERMALLHWVRCGVLP